MGASLSHIAKRFHHDRKGSPALEFALVAPLFFAAVFGTFELGRGLYERNRFSAAAAIATRAVALNPNSTESELKSVILDKLPNYNVDDLDITIGANQEIAGQDFKEIIIGYDFTFLVKPSHNFSGLRLESTRYAPVLSTPSS